MKYLFGVLGVLAVIVLTLVLVVNRGDDGQVADNVPTETLTSFANKNSHVSFTTYGPVIAEEERRAIRIVVTPSERRVEVLAGYNENVINSQVFTNNQAAYVNFLSALELQGYTLTRNTKITDERGFCPDGRRFEYSLRENSETKLNTWTSTCNGGTFDGRAAEVNELFQEQIPNYEDIVQTVEI